MRLYDNNGNIVVQEKIIDFYSLYRNANELKWISPIMQTGTYTLELQVLGEHSGWTDKSGVYGGSTGDFVAVDRVSILQGNGSTPTPSPTLKGDVNNSGGIDIVDALLIAQYYVDLNPAGFDAANADVNCDSSVTIVDALLVARYYVGLITDFCQGN